ncbi:AHH domain-containing protein [Archangium violaceum]|uniref:AHH domain-containing protein n=1 Tax=Archangium violaceum TaxID=83451 RepID=UPI001950B2EA|nr:AHH domain-containing protein [Archangium violaceum]QRN96570.1 AHH domain-containing protein [Archangium violaceum]
MSTQSWRHVVVALWLVLPISCATSPEQAPSGGRPLAEPKVVRTRELPGGALRLSFEPVAPDPALERLRVQEARTVLAAFDESFRVAEKRPRSGPRLLLVSAGSGGEPAGEWEARLREEYLSRFGPSLLPMPRSLEQSRLFLALKLSPRYMGAGVREAAQELFSSPVFLSSVALSVAVYFAAWLAPEPVFTKAFVAALTLRLSLAVGVLELTQLARACVRLYQEAEAARTVEELEAVAERFGKAMGGTALRVLILVASMGVAKGLPQVPKGGLWSLLGSPRFAFAGGGMMGGATTVQMVADGTLIVTGVAAGTAAATLGSACSDGSVKKEGHQWHHLATNKSDTSTLNGGPWTPLFVKIFAKAGMSLDAAENLVYLAGHKGPHPEEYHEEIYRRLVEALENCRTISQCGDALKAELRTLADDVCTPGSLLHRLLTKT